MEIESRKDSERIYFLIESKGYKGIWHEGNGGKLSRLGMIA